MPSNDTNLEVVNYHKTIYCPSSSSSCINYIKEAHDKEQRIDLAKINETSHSQGEFYFMHTSGIILRKLTFIFVFFFIFSNFFSALFFSITKKFNYFYSLIITLSMIN